MLIGELSCGDIGVICQRCKLWKVERNDGDCRWVIVNVLRAGSEFTVISRLPREHRTTLGVEIDVLVVLCCGTVLSIAAPTRYNSQGYNVRTIT